MKHQDKPTLVVVALPRTLDQGSSPQTLRLAQKCRALRLHALKTSPEAFAASYEVECERGLDQTVQRLISDKATNFVAFDASKVDSLNACRSGDPADTVESILAAKWIGMICLLGPREEGAVEISAKADMFSKMTGGERPERDLQTQMNSQTKAHLHYHLNGTFVDASARKCGLGMKLIDAAVREACSTAKYRNRGLVITVYVDDQNMAARGLYGKAGFVVTGREMYVQQPRAMVEGSDSHATGRVALRLELHHDASVSKADAVSREGVRRSNGRCPRES